MKKINLSIILVIVFFLLAPGCASKLPLVDSCRSNNGAISLEEFKKNIQEEEIQKKTHVKTFSESETNSSLDKKSVIPKKRKNNHKTLKTFEKYEKLEKRVANLETQTQTNTEILNKHSGYLKTHAQAINALSEEQKKLKQNFSNLQGNFNHSVNVIKNVNSRVGRLEDKDWHRGKALKKFKIEFKVGKTVPTASELKKLDQFIKKTPEIQPHFIFGATDYGGPIEKNRLIAAKRAEFIKQYLIEKQVIEPGEAKNITPQTNVETSKYGYHRSANRIAVIHYE